MTVDDKIFLMGKLKPTKMLLFIYNMQKFSSYTTENIRKKMKVIYSDK